MRHNQSTNSHKTTKLRADAVASASNRGLIS